MSADAWRARVRALLDTAAEQGRPITFWWRDDDAEAPAAALDRLLSVAERHALPLALAVVPKGATQSLAARLASAAGIAVLQHGWQHRNRAAPGEKKIEVGGARPPAAVLDELRRGRERLESLFPAAFLPVLVPPWNRIADPVREALPGVGLRGLSTYGAAPPGARGWVNTHLDIFAWKPERRPLAPAAAYETLAAEIGRRLVGVDEPLGILTHHRVHDEASWALLDDLLRATAGHRGARWPATPALFGLPECFR